MQVRPAPAARPAPPVARKILDHLELDATGPPLAAARRATDPIDPSPDYDVADPVYDA